MAGADPAYNRIAYAIGDPAEPTTQLGPVISERARRRILGHVDSAVGDLATFSTTWPTVGAVSRGTA